MTRIFIGLVLSCFIACNRPIPLRPVLLDIKPGQEVVTSIAWLAFSEYSGLPWESRQPPIVDWREAPDLDCGQGRGFLVSEDLCVSGVYVRPMHLAIVAFNKGQKLSQTSLVHELCHAFFQDNNHSVCSNERPPVQPINALLHEKGY